MLTRSIRDSETSIDFVQRPPGSRREWVNQGPQTAGAYLTAGGGGGVMGLSPRSHVDRRVRYF